MASCGNMHSCGPNDNIYRGSINENDQTGTFIVQVTTTDKDNGQNAAVQYAIISGNLNGVFQINPTSGAITNTQVLGPNTPQTYTLSVRASNPTQGVGVSGEAISTVIITVNDVNDSPPRFSADEFTVYINEAAQVGTTVTRITADDDDIPEGDRLTYAITAGNLGGYFQINPVSGDVTLLRQLDRELESQHNLTIRATDQGAPPQTDMTLLKVIVLDFNDNPPRWSQQNYMESIPEDTPVNTLVLQVIATDDDEGVNADLTFSINNANSVPFVIDNEGNIRTSGLLDREMEPQYNFLVTVLDNGSPQQAGNPPATVTINILDVNDEPPILDETSYEFTIAEDVNFNTFVGLITATDPDLTGTLTYTFVPADPDFSYTAGTIRTNAQLDANQQLIYQMTVFASDGVQNSQSAPVTINVLDVNNQPPSFGLGTYVRSLPEDSPFQTLVVDLNATDPDNGNTGLIIYSFESLSRTEGPFTVDPYTGVVEISTTAALDRETQDEYTLIVIAVDQPASGQPMTGTATVSVIVTDVNDNAPTFRNISYEKSVFENHPLGTNIVTVKADDPDLGVNAVVLYRIISGNTNNMFIIDGQGNINLGSTSLDRETQDQYILIVQAYNSDLSVGTNQVPVIINVLDVNDVTPTFQQQNYYRPDLSENSPAGTPVITVFAQDQDLDLAGDVQYSLVGNPNFLAINGETGVISVTGPISDLNGSRNFTMTVRATDKASPFLSGMATVIVTVVDDTILLPIFTNTRYPATVDENVNTDTFVTRVSATLNGSPAGITYTIDPNASPAVLEIFKIDENTGSITTEGAIDRELEDFYAFTVFASHEDSVAPGSTSVWVTIADKNDNAPVFTAVPSSPVSIPENMLGTVPVGIFTATDQDIGINAQMTFSISGPGSELFNVFQTASGGGTILAISPLDRETQDFYQLTVIATDGGNPALSSSFPINITVTDVNDNYPIWTSNAYDGSITENNFTSNPIITVMVTDRDLPSSNNFEYFIVNGDPMGMFQINNNGEITVSSLLDREEQGSYQLTIELRDQTNSPPAQTTTLALITVLDENDNTPIFDETNIRVDITEGPSSQGIPVYVMSASDIDLGLNKEVIYAFESQQPQSDFEINPGTGVISTITALDWESVSEYTLIVTATDQSPTEPRTGTATVIVSVNDINDGAPMFVQDVYGPYSVQEEVSNAYIDTFEATDTDQGLAGQITYSVIGQYSDLFFIQSQTGVLTVSPDRVLDYEDITAFNITVVATDMGNPALSSSTIVGINVININDHTPIFQGIPYTITLSKNITAGSLAYVVRATDDDAGIFGDVRYQITDGNVDNIFRIDDVIDSSGGIERKTGEVFAEGQLETGTYRLVIEARDTPGDVPNSRASSTTLTIVVTDIGELAPTFPGSSLFTGNVFENAPLGQPITMIPPIRAINNNANGQLVYTLIGPESQTFMINQLSAIIQVNGPLDRETKDFYEFEVIVTDSLGLRANGTVHINVLDVNDFAPVFNDSVYNFTIPENSPGGYYVGNVAAYDLDGDNVNFFIQTGGEDKFDIGATSGTITVAPGAVLDREVKPFYTLTVMVSDLRDPPLSGTATVYVYLTDINDSPPTFDPSLLDQTISIPEDTPGNTLVTTVTATDDDLNSVINYQIVSVSVYDEDDVDITSSFDYRTVFSLNPINGSIMLTSPVDREVTEEFVFTISARDLNSQDPIFGTSQEHAQITILITDINDNHPAFQPPGTTFILGQLPESFGAGSPIPGNLLALDPDLGLNGEVMYVIENPSSVPVTINQNTGQLTLLTTIDLEQQPWVNLTVLAIDKGTPSLNTSIPVYLEIIDNNDNNPVFGSQSYTTSIIESAPTGSFVFNVNATDADSGGNGRVTYSLIGGNGKFTINPDTGVITLLQQLDKETQAQHMLTVFARDNPGDSEDSRTGSTTVIVNVLDANELPPVVTPPIFTIDEGGAAGDLVGVIEAFDPDHPDDPNQSLYYVIVSSQPEIGSTLFTIDNATGSILTTVPLERDNGLHPAQVDLNLIVYDGGNPNLGTSVTAIIYINDLNDNRPMFDLPLYNVTVVEGQYSDPIITVVANDPDENSNLRYEILGGNLNNTFVIVDGGLIPVKALDFETFRNYNLTIVATDDSGNTDITYVAVTVTDANDHNPLFVPDLYSLSVIENELPGTQVGVVTAVDGDTHPDYTNIIYTILTGDNLGNFTINATTGIITTATILDREKTSEYVLTVGAENPVGGTTATATVSIIVRDVNDNTPIFEENPYTLVVTTNTLLVDVHANDPDEGGNGIVIYEIVSGNDDNRFTIDNRTGVITLVNPLEGQLVKNYTLVVIGHDLGTPRLQSNTTIDLVINYLGPNAPPSFVRPSQGSTVSITENNAVGMWIIDAFAVDNDFGDNGVVDYSILPNFDFNDFSIDPVTGNITILVSADREMKDSYTLTVVATDRGNPSLSTSSTFVIRVLDENDNDPAFPRPDGMNNPVVLNLNVFENANISDVVGTVSGAIDLDLGASGQIFYHIVESTVDGVFVINSTTGIITVNGSLDREDIGVHTVLVMATNDATYNGTGPYIVLDNISLKEVEITLLDINDNAPRFTSTVISACIPFDIRLDSRVVSVSVVDLDGGTNLGIRYSLTAIRFINSQGESTAAINAFRINNVTGEIVSNQQFGEAYLQGYFDMVVQATDITTGQFAVSSIRLCILNNNQRVVVVIDAGIDVVRDNREILIQVLENITGGIVFIDDITTYRDENGNIVPDQTQVLIHVVDRNTGEVLDANLVTSLIDQNAMSIEVLFDDLDVVKVYPLFGGGGLGGLGILEAALLAFGILLFLGALIFAIILCCLRRRLLRKMQGGGVTLGKAHADLLKENRSTSYQGSNPLWLDADTSQPDDWPDSISLLGGTVKDYEAQEATMNFLSDEIPVEIAEDAVVMTSMVSDKSIRNKMANGGIHRNGYANGHRNGYANGSVSTVKRVDTTNLNGGIRTLKNNVYEDGTVTAHMDHPWGGGGGLTEEHYSSTTSVTRSAPPPRRDETDSRQFNSSTRSTTVVRENQNSLRHRKILTEQTAAEIREMLQDMPPADLEQETEMAAAAYRQQMAYEAELTPITEEESVSSRSTNTRASSYRGQDSLERNKRNGTISKQYQDPMAKFAGESSLEEQYKEEEIDGQDSKTKIKSYSAKRVTNKVYSGRDMMAIPEMDSGEITMSSVGDIKIVNSRNISSSPQSSPSGEITLSESGEITVIRSKRRNLDMASTPTGEIILSNSGDVRFSLQRSPLAASTPNTTGEITLTNGGDVKFALLKRNKEVVCSPTGEIRLTGSGDVTFNLHDTQSSSTSSPIGEITLTSGGDVKFGVIPKSPISSDSPDSNVISPPTSPKEEIMLTDEGDVKLAMSGRKPKGEITLFDSGDVRFSLASKSASSLNSSTSTKGEITLLESGDIILSNKKKDDRAKTTLNKTSPKAKIHISILESGAIKLDFPDAADPIEDIDNCFSDHMIGGMGSKLAIQDDHSSMSGSSSPPGRSFTYQVLPDSGGSNAENPSVASHTLSSQSNDSGSRTGEFNLAMMDDDEDDVDVVEERRVRRTIKRETSGGDAMGAIGGMGRGYTNNGYNDEESAL
ncbi:cadherin-23-like [Lytechinus pictus]|uniref:cadherin-23-like n=1 Tax=Lytechinus pictus TaxID=7653 RepID=UPI0030B9E713